MPIAAGPSGLAPRLRVALRTLRKHPAFTAVAVGSLALSIALTTTMYGMLDALVSPRVDMRAPERLFVIRLYGDRKRLVDDRTVEAALRSGLHTYEALARYQPGFGSTTLFERGRLAFEGNVARVSGDWFDVLGVRPMRGRTFIPADTLAGARAVVLGERMAAQLFPGGASPVGATVHIDGVAHQVVGVVSRTSDFPRSTTDAWAVAIQPPQYGFSRVMRLREGVTPKQVEAELAVVSARLAPLTEQSARDVAFRFGPMLDRQFHYHRFHFALIGAVAAVLLIACANLANLQLARGIARRGELALRSALGASRRALVVELQVETAVLAAAGLLLGVTAAFWGGKALAAAVPPRVGEFIVEPQLSWRVLVFSAAVTVLCLVLVGVLPALAVSRVAPNEMLKERAGTGTTRGNRRRYGFLVVAELALALVLLSGAAVMLRTLARAEEVSWTIDTSRLVEGFVGVRRTWKTPPPRAELFDRLVEALRALPEIADAAVAGNATVLEHRISVDDAGGREIPAPLYGYTIVSPGYLRTMGLRILEGRDFRDGERDEPVAVVDRRTAHALWPNDRAIGRLLKLGAARTAAPYVRVIGIVDDPVDVSRIPAARRTAQEAALGRIYYLPGPADVLPSGASEWSTVRIFVRPRGDPKPLPVLIRRALRDLPDVRVFAVASMEDFNGLTYKRGSQRFVTWLFCAFGALALALAAFGVYGIVVHAVAERRRELGVRIALGATPRDILRAVLREDLVIALAGVALGLLLTKFGVPLLEAFAEEDFFYDAPAFALVALVLGATAATAALVPALRAARVDPVESLRNN